MKYRNGLQHRKCAGNYGRKTKVGENPRKQPLKALEAKKGTAFE